VPRRVFGIAQSLNIPNVYSLLNEDTLDDEHRGAFISLNSIVLCLGQVIGPLLVAAVAVPLGLGGSYFAAAALVAGMFFVAYFFIR
jgi:MFS transporter, ACDE family, multidrug resistance protein